MRKDDEMISAALPDRHDRLEALDGLRGLAAVSVVAWHFLMGFNPHRIMPDEIGHFAFAGTPLMGLINGVAAVTLFFTLSGFVLPLAFYRSGNRALLLRGAMKRYFRLVGIVFIAIMASYILYATGAYYFQDAARLTSSGWLETAGTGQHITPSFRKALSRALFWVFVRGDNDYDTTLWTIKYEFLGSFLTFGFAALFFQARLAVIGIICLIAVLIFHQGIFYFTPFIVGAGASLVLSRRPLQLSNRLSAVLLVVGFFLMGDFTPIGWYSFLSFLHDPNVERLRADIYTVASLLMIIGIVANPSVAAFLSLKFFQFLGTISFPMYAIHPLIYFSLTSWLYVELHPLLPETVVLTTILAISLPIIVTVSYGLARCDKMWLRYLDLHLPRLHAASVSDSGLHR